MADGIMGAFTGMFRGRRREDEIAQVDAEITAFGEALAQHSFVPRRHADDQALLADYERALDAYEQAKRDFVGDRNLRDAADVMRALDEGRHALACVEAVAAGRARPERRPLCFFDPRHGPSTGEIQWAPPEGAARTVAVCAADAIRLSEGMPPIDTGRREPTAQRPEVRQSAPPTASAVQTPRTGRRPGPRPPVTSGQRLPPRPSDPYDTWPEDTGVPQRREGRGATGLQLVRTDPRKPALLVFHLGRTNGSWVELTSPAGRGGKPRTILTHGSALSRVIVPVEADGQERIRIQAHTRGAWRAWLHSLERVPVLEDELRAHGSYVFRCLGGRTPLRVTQHDGSAFSLHELRPDLTLGRSLVEGEGALTAVATPKKHDLLYVQSRASWTITRVGSPRN
ncbi:hypothetical protein ACFRMN_08740 [Streptomyces sp. NPDC056835]|uniref:hypothetical protein n=1 Tax=Streptomyces sp. NPDC056835 TaxID=3345956 RepID=UPI0036882F96